MQTLRNIHIPAGSFSIQKKAPVVLQAYLSSCVGVVLFDPVNAIGGIIHLLLPEPVSASCFHGPEKYASTGLPLFISSLLESGAEQKYLKAVIAGGALSHSLSQLDISLDIGGRTAETVKGILSKESIPVISSETGGFFSCCMNFNLNTFETTVTPAMETDRQGSGRHVPTAPEDIASVIDNLMPIPQVALKILRMINEDSYNIQTVSQEVRKDQIISAQVLKYCNSAVFARKTNIESIDDALLIIGQYNLSKIVTTVAVHKLLNSTTGGYSLTQGWLYHHAIGVGLVAEALALKTERATPFAAYTAGLLHDIGKVVLDQFVAPAAPLFYREIQNSGLNMLEVEDRLLSANHTETGHKLALKWDLPDSITEAILFHHRPEASGSHHDLVSLVYLADLLVHMFSAGPNLSAPDMNSLIPGLKILGLSLADFPDIIDAIPVHTLTAMPELAIT